MSQQHPITISSWTLGDQCTFEERVSAANAGGFEGIGLRAENYVDALNEGLSDADILSILKQYNMQVTEVEYIVQWAEEHRSYEQKYKEQMCYHMCELFGVNHINCGLMENYSIDYTAQKLRELCKRAGSYMIGVEFMPYSGLADVQKAWAVVRESGCDNAKLILDSWHWIRSGHSYDPAILVDIPAEKIVSIQINDVQAHPYAKSILREESMHDRMMPGTGFGNTAGFIKMIREKGIEPAVIGVEVINDEILTRGVQGSSQSKLRGGQGSHRGNLAGIIRESIKEEFYMENRISGHTQLYCLLGSPVGHSGSPAMYNYSFARTGVDAVYLAFDIPLDKLAEGIAAVKALHVKGFNVTMPDKTPVMEYLDEITPVAKLIGACNTVIVSEDGRLIGHNTDCVGFSNNLHAHGIELLGKNLVVLGIGGAATAICVQAALDGALEISIFNRKDEFYRNGLNIVKKLAEVVPSCKVSICDLDDSSQLSAKVKECEVLINATKVGMKPMEKETLVDSSLLHPDLIVVDTVYNPLETRLIKEAKAAGCKAAIGGIGMLLWQGVAAFKLFTGKDMPTQEVQEKFFS